MHYIDYTITLLQFRVIFIDIYSRILSERQFYECKQYSSHGKQYKPANRMLSNRKGLWVSVKSIINKQIKIMQKCNLFQHLGLTDDYRDSSSAPHSARPTALPSTAQPPLLST